MGCLSARITILLVITALACWLGTTMANKDMMMKHNMTDDEWGGGWRFGSWPSYNSTNWPSSPKNHTHSGGPNRIIVGGSSNWKFGFNYTDWALKNGPVYLNDILVFKYGSPVNGLPGHSVYLLPDFRSYLNCDLRRAKLLATSMQGEGNGFEFKLTTRQPHYFACGEHNNIHCNLGKMKFFVMPISRDWN